MSIPIYQSDSHQAVNFDKGNKGLFFERFFNKYDISTNKVSVGDEAKKEFLSTLKNPNNNDSDFTACATRQMALARATSGNGCVYSLDGHFVTGMGNSHPVENGFLWHYTLGTPYLSGSQVKGLVRSLVEQYYDNDDKKDILLQWFGSNDKNSSNTQAGELIFFDALPYGTAPILSNDIMTPHMGNWYSDGGKISDVNKDSDKIPADWHDPIPVPFLAVKSAKFLFTIGKRSNSNIDITDVFGCLNQALTFMGAGAKTQTGYGFMTFDGGKTDDLISTIKEKQQKELAKKKEKEEIEASLKGQSELAQKFLIESKEKSWNTPGNLINKGNQEISGGEKWLALLEETPDADTIEQFKLLIESLYKGIYDNPDKKQGKQQKPAYKKNAIIIVKTLKKIESKK